MKVVARARIVEAGALRKPGDVFEVSKERFKSLGDVVEETTEDLFNLEPPDGLVDGSNPGEKGVPEPEPEPDVRKQSPFDKVKSFFGFKNNKVDLDASNLSKITREDLEPLTKDQINDLFANFEGLELKPKMKHGEMIDAVFKYIEKRKEEGSGENGSN